MNAGGTVDGEDDDQDIPVAVPDVVKEGALLFGAGVSASNSSMRICLLDTLNGASESQMEEKQGGKKAEVKPKAYLSVIFGRLF